MTKILYINASPRGDASASTQAADIFLQALPATVNVTSLVLPDAGLPPVTENVVNAKFKFAMGAAMSEAEASEWKVIEELAAGFLDADHYLLAVPMWNYSVPYTMKQYIDLITHPGLTFARGENGMKGLASGGATIVYARGGDYSPKNGQPDPFDFQSPYLKAWLGMVGVEPIGEVLVQSTMAGPDALKSAVEKARAQLESLAAALV